MTNIIDHCPTWKERRLEMVNKSVSDGGTGGIRGNFYSIMSVVQRKLMATDKSTTMRVVEEIRGEEMEPISPQNYRTQ